MGDSALYHFNTCMADSALYHFNTCMADSALYHFDPRYICCRYNSPRVLLPAVEAFIKTMFYLDLVQQSTGEPLTVFRQLQMFPWWCPGVSSE
jgi:hypothetical protein